MGFDVVFLVRLDLLELLAQLVYARGVAPVELDFEVVDLWCDKVLTRGDGVTRVDLVEAYVYTVRVELPDVAFIVDRLGCAELWRMRR